jgi:hypothetical protein
MLSVQAFDGKLSAAKYQDAVLVCSNKKVEPNKTLQLFLLVLVTRVRGVGTQQQRMRDRDDIIEKLLSQRNIFVHATESNADKK